MRIALLTPEYITPTSCDGGLANYLKKTAQAMVQRGCEVWVFVESKRDKIWFDDDVRVCEIQCDHHVLEIAGRIRLVNRLVPLLSQIYAFRNLAKEFWKVHAKSPFDVIHASSYMAPGFALLHNGKVPVVCRVSSYTPIVRAVFGVRQSMGDRISDWIELKQVSGADASFAPSRFVAAKFATITGREPTILRTPVDLQRIEPEMSYFLENRPVGRYLLFFGTLSRIKGVDLLAQILPGVFERYDDLSMVFIGRDDGLPDGTKVFEHVLDSCKDYAGRLQYHGALNKAKLYPFIEHAEAVVMPSRVDNYPNACLEAQMFGIPVIGTYDSSLDEMIINGITGFLARNGDPEDILDAVERCINQSAVERKAMRQRIVANIDSIKSEDRIGQLLAFYRETTRVYKERHGIS